MRRLPLVVLVAALTAPFLAACSDGPGGGGGADLVVYSGRSEKLVAPLFAAFEKATGLDVDVRYGGSAELAAQLLEEGDNSPADAFFSQDAGALGALAKADRLAPLDSSLMSKVAPAYRGPGASWVGVTGRQRVIAYNARRLTADQLPRRVSALTEPAWADRVGIAPTNASFHSFVTAMRVIEGEKRTRDFLEGLVRNRVQKYENNVQVLEAVERGEVDAGLINHYYWFEKVAELGGEEKLRTRLAYLDPADPGALVNVSGIGLLRGAKHAPAATRLVEHLLNQSSQADIATRLFEYPLATDVTVTLPTGLRPVGQLQGPALDLSDLDSLDETLRLLDEVGLT